MSTFLSTNDLQDIYKHLNVAIITLDTDLNIKSANPHSKIIFKEDPTGENLKKYVPKNYNIENLFDIKKNIFIQHEILRWIDSNGHNVYLNIMIIVQDDKNILLCYDVTKKEQAIILAEKRKSETEQILNGIVRYNFSYSVRERDNKRVFTISPNLKELFGFKDDDIPSEHEGYIPWFARVPESYRAKAIARFERFINNDDISEIESIYPFTAANGEIVTIQTNSVKIKDAEGNFKAIIGSIRRLDDVLRSLDDLRGKNSVQEKLNQRQVVFNTFILRSILYSISGFVWFGVFSYVRGGNREAIWQVAGLAEILLVVQLLPPILVVSFIIYRILIFMGKEENKNG